MPAQRVPVLEIGGTHVSAARVDVGAWNVAAGTLTRHPMDAGESVDRLLASMVAAAASLRAPDGATWGVAIPGPFDYDRGVGDFRGVGKFEALRGVHLGDLLRAALTEGTGEVRFLGDAEAFAVGEWVAGAARGHRRAIGVTLGTGVGSAFLVDGRAHVHGAGVPPQGRLDLLEVDGHRLEERVSRRAIRARHAALAADESAARLDVRDIVDRARRGDLDARRAVDEPLHTLGRVLASRAVDFGASVVVVGGSIARGWDVIEDPLRRGMSAAAPGWLESVTITPAERIEEAALVGAAWRVVTGTPGPGARS